MRKPVAFICLSVAGCAVVGALDTVDYASTLLFEPASDPIGHAAFVGHSKDDKHLVRQIEEAHADPPSPPACMQAKVTRTASCPSTVRRPVRK